MRRSKYVLPPAFDLVNRRIVRHRVPTGAAYEQQDDFPSGAVPLPALGVELSLAELF